MTGGHRKTSADKFYKNTVLTFSGIQVAIASLQLSNSISESSFNINKWGGLFLLAVVSFILWYLHKKMG